MYRRNGTLKRKIYKKMSSEIELLITLKSQLITFLDELIETFPNEADFVIFRIFIKDRLPISDIMDYIVKNLCPLRDLVKNRDANFFLGHNILFEKFDEEKSHKVNHFKRLWQSGELDKNDKETIWQWFDSFIHIGNKYNELRLEKMQDIKENH